MSRGTLFWVLVLLSVILGAWGGYDSFGRGNYLPLGMSLLHLVLFGLLGWQAFGPPIHG